MEKERSRERIQEKILKKEVVTSKKSNQNVCGKCGNKNESNAAFCEECGYSLKNHTCSKCNANLLPGADVCEICGQILILTKCAFCGSDKDEADNFCPECGCPASGIVCSKCNTLNHANFCSHCNNPLTNIALQELEKAKNDPLFIEAKQIMNDIAQLQQEMEAVSHELEIEQSEPIEEKKKAENDFSTDKQIFEELANYTQKGKSKEPIAPPRPKPIVTKQKKVFDAASHDRLLAERDKRAQEINQKLKLLQEKLDDMANIDFPCPQDARTYHSARKPPIENLVWNCKYNDSLHPDPRNCGQPQHGGKWIIELGRIEWQTHHGDC